jgi:hypothetical protein
MLRFHYPASYDEFDDGCDLDAILHPAQLFFLWRLVPPQARWSALLNPAPLTHPARDPGPLGWGLRLWDRRTSVSMIARVGPATARRRSVRGGMPACRRNGERPCSNAEAIALSAARPVRRLLFAMPLLSHMVGVFREAPGYRNPSPQCKNG